MRVFAQCIINLASSHVNIIGTAALSEKEGCNAEFAQADATDALLQVTQWHILHTSISASASAETLLHNPGNASSVALDNFETQNDNRSSIPWMVAGSHMLSLVDFDSFGEEKPFRVVDPADEAPKVPLRHSFADDKQRMQRFQAILGFGGTALLLLIAAKSASVMYRGNLQKRFENFEPAQPLYFEYRTHLGGKWHRAEYVMFDSSGHIVLRRCKDGLIVSQKNNPKHVRKAKPPPILPPLVATPHLRRSAIGEQVRDIVGTLHSQERPTAAVAAATVLHVAAESSSSGEEDEQEDEKDLQERLAEGASLALMNMQQNVESLESMRPKKLVKGIKKDIKGGLKKIDKELDKVKEQAQENLEDAFISARMALEDPTAAMMEGVDALQGIDVGQVASGAAGAVTSAAGAVTSAAGAVSGAASSVVDEAAKQIHGARKKHFQAFKTNLAKATKKAKDNIKDAHADTVGTISGVVSDARNVAQKTSKASKTLMIDSQKADKAESSAPSRVDE